jgi:hypothetical protein
MKSFLVAASAALVLMACSQTSYPSTDPYPNPDNRNYPPDYPREGQRDGVVTIIRTENSSNYEHLPPGQAKKRYGGRSARVYAPGQQKRNGSYGYGLATVIAVPDRYASRAASGQFYYNYRRNIYWKQNDGYYYLAR